MYLKHHIQGKKIKGHGHQAGLFTAALTAAAVIMKTYWAWGTTATMCLLGAGEPTGNGAGRGHTVSPHTQLVIWRWKIPYLPQCGF